MYAKLGRACNTVCMHVSKNPILVLRSFVFKEEERKTNISPPFTFHYDQSSIIIEKNVFEITGTLPTSKEKRWNPNEVGEGIDRNRKRAIGRKSIGGWSVGLLIFPGGSLYKRCARWRVNDNAGVIEPALARPKLSETLIEIYILDAQLRSYV